MAELDIFALFGHSQIPQRQFWHFELVKVLVKSEAHINVTWQ